MKTLRDEFAMAAMSGDIQSALNGLGNESDGELLERAELYYRLANAMCTARDRTKPRPKVHQFRRRDDPKQPE